MIIGVSEDNRDTVTKKRLEDLIVLTKRVSFQLLEQADEGVLTEIKTVDGLNKFNSNLETIVLDKLIKKFNIK